MAVYNDYTNTQILAGTPNRASALAGGAKVVEYLEVFDTVAAHDAASIYRVFKKVPSTLVPLDIRIWTDGVTGMSDVDVCLYAPLDAGGAEVGTEVLASTLDLSSAVTKASALNGMGNVTNSNYGKPLWELAGETITDRLTHYDIGLKSVADLSEADTIVVHARFALA